MVQVRQAGLNREGWIETAELAENWPAAVSLVCVEVAFARCIRWAVRGLRGL